MMKEIEEGLRQAIEWAGSSRALAGLLGLTPQAFSEWRRVPADRVVQVEAVTGIPRETLRPDLYRHGSMPKPSTVKPKRKR